jgi:hypothetical protein
VEEVGLDRLDDHLELLGDLGLTPAAMARRPTLRSLAADAPPAQVVLGA